MKLRLVGIVFSQLMTALLLAQPQSGVSKPQVTPAFLEERAPAFILECTNTTGTPIRPGRTGDMMRIDGQVRCCNGYATSGPQSPLIAPGGSWKELIVLHAGHSATARGPSLGAMIRSDATIDIELTPGRHTVEFQCGGAWSDENAFYWEEASH
jgi:hypothetical protein